LKAIYDADDEGLITWPADLSAEDLADLRSASELLPEERMMAVVPLSHVYPTVALVFGSQHIYFPAKQHGEPIRCSLTYEKLAGCHFINHGKSLYVGDGITLTPENDSSCDSLAALLNAAKRAVESA